MKSLIKSILLSGSSGFIVDIECHLSNGLPGIIIVGLGNKAVVEAKDRIRSAFASSGLSLPRKRITINLAPADIPKHSTSLDLAIAAAILQAATPEKPLWQDCLFIGEIGLNGIIRPVRGIIGMLLAAKEVGIRHCILPESNMSQAKYVSGIRLTAANDLASILNITQAPIINVGKPIPLPAPATEQEPGFAAIAGQDQAKRALEIAAAGGHNILLHGPPGTGKSLLAKALPTILPAPTPQEVLEITHIHSLASQNFDELITTRPFRSPHSSASFAAIIGGGDGRLPGEIALSNHGILFLDELPEFNRTILESLRQPLEDHCITISRARYSVRYSTRFILVATANPCPCGYYGTSKTCICTTHQVLQYQQRISGPILDRIDLHVVVDTVSYDQLLRTNATRNTIKVMRQRIAKAHQIQRNRTMTGQLNGSLKNIQLASVACLAGATRTFLDTAASRLDISARSYVKLVKVARTIADLEGSTSITEAHISEALQYRYMRRIS